MQIAANCQKEGRPIIYVDAEGRLKDMNFHGGSPHEFQDAIDNHSIAVGDKVQFINESIGATAYLWSFGDGLPTSNDFSPIFEYPIHTYQQLSDTAS